jgi:hypothetical protein
MRQNRVKSANFGMFLPGWSQAFSQNIYPRTATFFKDGGRFSLYKRCSLFGFVGL